MAVDAYPNWYGPVPHPPMAYSWPPAQPGYSPSIEHGIVGHTVPLWQGHPLGPPWGYPVYPGFGAGYGVGGTFTSAVVASMYHGPYTGWGWGYGASLRDYGPNMFGFGPGMAGPFPQHAPQHAPRYPHVAEMGQHPGAHLQAGATPPGAKFGPNPYTQVWSAPVVRSDMSIHREILDRMAASGHLDASHLTISVDHGEVTLNGIVPGRAEKRLAEAIADAVPGVRDVHNHLSIQPQRFP